MMAAISNFVYHFRIAKTGYWEVTSAKEEKYIFGFYFGKVKRGKNSAFLIVLGPIYFIFGWKK